MIRQDPLALSALAWLRVRSTRGQLSDKAIEQRTVPCETLEIHATMGVNPGLQHGRPPFKRLVAGGGQTHRRRKRRAATEREDAA